MTKREEQMAAFGRLLDIMDELRERCPWDRKQTFDSLRCNTIEEAFELADAVFDHDMRNVKKELGDVLLHIVFYAKMGEEQGEFDIADVCNALCDKLIFRHPHIYGEVDAATSEEVKQNWEQLKRREKDGNKSVLSGVPKSLPSLIKTYRIQDKVSNVGFDWEERSQVWAKVREELAEFGAEAERMDADRMEGEMGDVLFSLVNVARLYGINPDNALERTNKKFVRRFEYLEEKTLKQGRELRDMSLKEMDEIWEEAKNSDE